MSDMTGLKLALTTCADRKTADRLATTLVDQALAACVNVVPGVISTYRWMGKIERDDEVLVLMKTATTRLAEIETTIRRVSGYDVPELVVVDIAGGSADYLGWVADSVGSVGQEDRQ